MTTRRTDTDNITLSISEFAEAVRAGGESKSLFKEWIRIIIAITIPMVAGVFAISKTSFQVEQNRQEIQIQREWINDHLKTTEDIRDSINSVEKGQAVLLEKFVLLQKEIEVSIKNQ